MLDPREHWNRNSALQSDQKNSSKSRNLKFPSNVHFSWFWRIYIVTLKGAISIIVFSRARRHNEALFTRQNGCFWHHKTSCKVVNLNSALKLLIICYYDQNKMKIWYFSWFWRIFVVTLQGAISILVLPWVRRHCEALFRRPNGCVLHHKKSNKVKIINSALKFFNICHYNQNYMKNQDFKGIFSISQKALFRY